MATTLSIPPVSPAGSSPSSDDSALHPHTPLSPGSQAVTPPSPMDTTSAASVQASGSSSVNPKRKPSRRANTAERRATHNAVERQRRETLNGRFLDLAGLLPNLSQIRRPSKSSIVNSSIAHIHAARRHRLLASRELRLLKLEADALRRELNEWRDRSGLPRVEEPVRGEGFAMVLSAEVEALAAVPDEEEENSAHGGYDGYDEPDDEFGAAGGSHLGVEEGDDLRLSQAAAAAAMLKNVNAHPFSHSLPVGANGHVHNSLPRSSHGPVIAPNPLSVSFENPAMTSLYEPHPQGFNGGGIFMQQQQSQEVEKAAWNAQVFLSSSQSQQQILQARGFLTPPGSAPQSASANPPPNPFTDPNGHAFFNQLQRQQVSPAHSQQSMGHIYASPEVDDASSVGSVHSEQGNGSGYCTPPLGSPAGTYELASADPPTDFGAPRRMSTSNLQIPPAGAWCRPSDNNGDGMGMMKQSLGSPITVGGGSGGGFLMMM